MADIPYSAWLDFALEADALSAPHGILELFAGHAPLSGIAIGRGLLAVALDLEPAMLIGSSGDRVCASAEALPFADASFTLAVSTNASINYCRELPELADHLGEVRRVLTPRGAYVFDCCTPGRAETLHLKTMRSPSGEITFSHTYNRQDNYLETTVAVEGKGIEKHWQRIFSGAELKHVALAAGFHLERRVANYALPVAAGIEPIVTYVLRPA